MTYGYKPPLVTGKELVVEIEYYVREGLTRYEIFDLINENFNVLVNVNLMDMIYCVIDKYK